jgi:hypothetical protein
MSILAATHHAVARCEPAAAVPEDRVEHGAAADLGFGRIVVSEREAPNMLANMV